MDTVDLYNIVNLYLDDQVDLELTQFGRPQIMLNKLKCKLLNSTQEWTSSSYDEVELDDLREEHTGERQGPNCVNTQCRTSRMGDYFMITRGRLKGYEKSVKIMGPLATGYKVFTLHPGQVETSDLDEVSIELNTGHRTNYMSDVDVLEDENSYTGDFSVVAKLYGLVRFLSGSGRCVSETPIEQIVQDLKMAGNPEVSMLDVVKKNGLAHYVTWTMEGEGKIYWNYELTLDWM